MQFDYKARIARAARLETVKTVGVVPGANLKYFTGLDLHLSERPTLAFFGRTGNAIVIPELEVPQLGETESLGIQVFPWSDADGYTGALADAISALELGPGDLGVDGQTMRLFEYLALQEAGAKDIHDIGQTLRHLRATKTTAELDALRESIRMTEDVLASVTRGIRPGMTERGIADTLNQALTEAGSEGTAFSTLVQTGPNSGIPHGGVSNRALQAGEFLLIDFGGVKHGYPADITRTFCVGEPSPEMDAIYDTVLQANYAAFEAAGPGVPAGEVDRAARDVIETAGYGQYFIHRTGHGMGLEVHELPQIAAGNDLPLEPGMVFTIEPGIYVPGLGGVRIEDDVHVTSSGVESLTAFARELRLTGK